MISPPTNPFAAPNSDIAGYRAPAEDLEGLWFEHAAKRDRLRGVVFVAFTVFAAVSVVPAYWIVAWIQVMLRGSYLVYGTAAGAGFLSLFAGLSGWVGARFLVLRWIEEARLRAFCERAGITKQTAAALERRS